MSTSMKLNLSKTEVAYLQDFRNSDSLILKKFIRATVFLSLNKGISVSSIEELLDIDRITIWRIKKRYLTYGLEAALTDVTRIGKPVKYTSYHESKLIALVNGPAPEGKKRWTIRLIVKELNKEIGFETITYATVQKLLKKTNVRIN